ncbi:MAG: InlB B-repeat-containing protein [Christensenellales bacterium]
MNKKWKVILIALLMLPIVVFFPGCNCSCGTDPNQTNKPNNQYIVTFYTNSADTFNIPSQTVNEGNLVRKPENPVKTGYIFIGWYQDASLTKVWRFEIDTVKSNMTLYARWQERT